MREYYGVKLKPTDNRFEKFKQQRKERGFDDSETWALDLVVARFLSPRLKRFKELSPCHPPAITHQEWMEIVGKIIVAMELIVAAEDERRLLTVAELRKVKDGCKLLGKWFCDLWW